MLQSEEISQIHQPENRFQGNGAANRGSCCFFKLFLYVLAHFTTISAHIFGQ